MDRRATLERAFAKAQAAKPGPRVAKDMTDLQIAAEVVRSVKDPAVGGMTKLLYALAPEDRQRVTQVANLYDQHREAGRHGRPEHVLDAFAVDKDVADAVVDGLNVDYVAAELQRRRGSDADRPLPELTRRDHIDAAIDAHSAQE